MSDAPMKSPAEIMCRAMALVDLRSALGDPAVKGAVAEDANLSRAIEMSIAQTAPEYERHVAAAIKALAEAGYRIVPYEPTFEMLTAVEFSPDAKSISAQAIQDWKIMLDAADTANTGGGNG